MTERSDLLRTLAAEIRAFMLRPEIAAMVNDGEVILPIVAGMDSEARLARFRVLPSFGELLGLTGKVSREVDGVAKVEEIRGIIRAALPLFRARSRLWDDAEATTQALVVTAAVERWPALAVAAAVHRSAEGASFFPELHRLVGAVRAEVRTLLLAERVIEAAYGLRTELEISLMDDGTIPRTWDFTTPEAVVGDVIEFGDADLDARRDAASVAAAMRSGDRDLADGLGRNLCDRLEQGLAVLGVEEQHWADCVSAFRSMMKTRVKAALSAVPA